jgi:hypothetical protein
MRNIAQDMIIMKMRENIQGLFLLSNMKAEDIFLFHPS